MLSQVQAPVSLPACQVSPGQGSRCHGNVDGKRRTPGPSGSGNTRDGDPLAGHSPTHKRGALMDPSCLAAVSRD